MIASHERPNKGATDVWLTPLSIVNALGPFDLDPCGFPGHRTADCLITLPDDGLFQPWSGRVWLNPPYSNVEVWLQRLVNHGTGVALVFARTETRWAQKILPHAESVFFPAKRIRFLKSDFTVGCHSSGAPSMFLSFGESPNWSAMMPGWIAK